MADDGTTAIGRRAGDGCARSAFAHHCPLKLGLSASLGPTALRPSSTVASRPCLRHVTVSGALVMYINATYTTPSSR